MQNKFHAPGEIDRFVARLSEAEPAAIAALCRNRVGLLKRHVAITTARSAVTRYRDAIRRRLGRNHPSLAFLRLRDADQERVALEYRQTLQTRHSARRRLSAARHVTIALLILLGAAIVPSLELAGAIIALTGRRPVEVLKTGTFSRRRGQPPYAITFCGQAKSKGRRVDAYSIPVLAPAQLVLEAIAILRHRYDLRSLTAEQVDRRCSAPLGKYVAGKMSRQMSSGFADVDGTPLTPKDLRAAYAAITYSRAVARGSRASFNSHAAKVLGHSPNDLTTSLSYDVFVVE